MRHELSDKGELQLRVLAKITGAFVEMLAKSISKLALAVEEETKQKIKCHKEHHE